MYPPSSLRGQGLRLNGGRSEKRDPSLRKAFVQDDNGGAKTSFRMTSNKLQSMECVSKGVKMRMLLITLLFVSSVSFAENGKIAGHVVDVYRDGIIGAAVQIVETFQGVAVMNLDGSYAIADVEAGTYTIRISSLGYIRETLYDVTVDIGLVTVLNIVLKEDPRARGGVFDWHEQRPQVQMDSSDSDQPKQRKQKRSWFLSLFRKIF